jgi:3-oxoacyl-[acyl-carrier protein] reductase
MTDKPLAGKVALVTGASRGIGAAIAKRLAVDGAKVAVNYSQSPAAAEEVVGAITKSGGTAVAIRADVSDAKAITGLFAAVKKQFGQLDILVNNAAVMKRGLLSEVTVEDIDRHLGLNVRGYLLCAKEAATMLPRGGVIINVTSVISRMAYAGSVVYSLTKGAIDVMTRVLAAELGPKGIRVNAVAPGSTRTDMNSAASGKTDAEAVEEIKVTALGRQGEPEDIADAVAFFCTDDARWVTGAWLDVSGGIRL